MGRRWKFKEDQATYIRERFKEKVDGATANVNLSDAKWTVWFRAFEPHAPDTLVLSQLMSKASEGTESAGKNGLADGFVTFEQGYEKITCQMVRIDTSVDYSSSLSGKREVCWLEYDVSVSHTPQ